MLETPDPIPIPVKPSANATVAVPQSVVPGVAGITLTVTVTVAEVPHNPVSFLT